MQVNLEQAFDFQVWSTVQKCFQFLLAFVGCAGYKSFFFWHTECCELPQGTCNQLVHLPTCELTYRNSLEEKTGQPTPWWLLLFQPTRYG